MNEIITYNKKGFLVPDSIRSTACYRAKILSTGEYMFSIHDCITGVRLRGDITDPQEVAEAIEKLRRLAAAASRFADFIEANYPR
jgi:metal-responsive CopG/Arc/MetJ family transcriptional regulator